MVPLFLSFGFNYCRFFFNGASCEVPVQVDLPLPKDNGDGLESNTTATMREDAQRWWRKYECSCVYQDIWAAKLPWSKLVMGDDWKVHQVRYLVCTKIDGR
jgi:hypothetical protein